MMSLLVKLPGGRDKYTPLLLTKIKELLPDLLAYICGVIDMPMPSTDSPLSADTRFMYEEEVGQGLHDDLRKAR